MKTDNLWEQQLAAKLRAEQTYLEDDGFTAGMLAALPPESAGLTPAKYRGLLVVPPLLVSAAIVLQGTPWQRLQAVWAWLAAGDTMSLLSAGAMLSAGLLVACGAWLAREMKVL